MEAPTTSAETVRQIRGSLLLLCGRMLSLGLNFIIQVVIVRHLTKSDYGAFAYGLTVATLGSSAALLGLDRVVAVFVPMYHERRQYGRLFGTITVVLGTTVPLSAAVVLLVVALHGTIQAHLGVDPQAMALLVVLIVLVPIQALDGLVGSAFAVLGKPRAIFVRAYLLAPGLNLLATVVFVGLGSDVYTLAIAYVAAALGSLLFCSLLLLRMLSGTALLRRVRTTAIEPPVGAVFGFAWPLVVSDLRFMLGSATAVLVLEQVRGTADVAALRAVLPIALLNMVVFQSFRQLYAPMAARLLARNDGPRLNEVYCLIAVWIAVLSFPIFLVTFVFPRSFLVFLYGVRYEESGAVLSVLSAGYYFTAALGFNGMTLRILGQSRYIVTVDLVGAVGGFVLTVLLTRSFGAFGAALSTSATLIGLNIFYQLGLVKTAGVRLTQWRWMKTYVLMAASTIGCGFVQLVLAPHALVSIGLAAVVGLVVLRASIASLNVEQIFPEALRHPLARRLLILARYGAPA